MSCYRIKPLEWRQTADNWINDNTVLLETFDADNKLCAYQVWSSPSGKMHVKGGLIKPDTLEMMIEIYQKCDSIDHGKSIAENHFFGKMNRVLVEI